MTYVPAPMTSASVTTGKRIAFLYNHEAAHQVAHSASVITALLDEHPDLEISLLATSDVLIEAVRLICGPDIGTRCQIIKLEVTAWHRPFLKAIDLFAPISRIDYLRANTALLATFDAIIVTERTSLLLQNIASCRHVKLIYLSHGSGDRSIGFVPELGRFDLILQSGEKLRQRFLDTGAVGPEQIKVVGALKLDAVARTPVARDRYFADDKPIVLYNPHLEPRLSSWYTMGLQVFDVFLDNPDYNLIFAPHVMLFQRRVQVSLESFTIRLRRDLPQKYAAARNIHIDTGSAASADMTYTRLADIYLGDASSQVYEFLATKLRPCIHINSHQASWRDNPDYRFWTFGQVISAAHELPAALAKAQTGHATYRDVQAQAIDETYSQTAQRPSIRAAEAIEEFLKKPQRSEN